MAPRGARLRKYLILFSGMPWWSCWQKQGACTWYRRACCSEVSDSFGSSPALTLNFGWPSRVAPSSARDEAIGKVADDEACVMNRRLDRELQLHDRMVARCAIDRKFHSVLVRRCIQLRQLLTAVDVARAAYHLPGGALSSRPRPVGTEPRTLKELVRKLKTSSEEDSTGVSTCTTNCHTRQKFRGEGPQP